jgi:predicted membrane protein
MKKQVITLIIYAVLIVMNVIFTLRSNQPAWHILVSDFFIIFFTCRFYYLFTNLTSKE